MISTSDVIARDMVSQDLIEVLAIENNAQASPWSRLSFEESLTREHRCRVLARDGDIVAYHVVCAVLDELHILNLVVARPYQGQGLGHALLHDVLAVARQSEVSKIFLEVRASNSTAQLLYQKWQFKQIGMRKGYYAPSDQSAGHREDALVFAKVLADGAF